MNVFTKICIIKGRKRKCNNPKTNHRWWSKVASVKFHLRKRPAQKQKKNDFKERSKRSVGPWVCCGRRFLSFHAHHGRHFRLYLTPNFIWWRAYAPPRPYGPRKGSSSSSKPRRGSSSRRGTACCIKLCSNLKRCSSAWRGNRLTPATKLR